MTAADQRLRAVEERFPVGRRVRFYPVAGETAHEDTKVRSKPWMLGHGDIVVAVEGRAGGVHIDHLEVI